MPQDTVVDDLLRLGLTLNEAKAYTTLVSLGISTARSVAESSGVPRSKVYDTLDLLCKRGIVNTIQGSDPKKFSPIPPKTAIQHLFEKVEASTKSALTALEGLEQDREASQEQFVWAVQGNEQIKLDLISSINNAQETVFLATRSPSMLSPLRTALADAKKRGVSIELHTTKFMSAAFKEFRHYMQIQDSIPTSKALIESMKQVLMDTHIEDVGWNPDQMSIIVIDGKESIAIFESASEQQKPWGLHINNPLIVLIQWQVIKTALAAVDSLLADVGITHDSSK